MFCVKCGKEIPDDSEFCPFCGQATVEKNAEEANALGGYANSNVFEKIQGSVMERLKVFPKRFQIAMILAVIATVFWVITIVVDKVRLGKPGNPEDIFAVFGFIFSFATYICAGLFSALKIVWNTVWSAAKFGWFVIPFFPIDLLVAFLCFGTTGIIALLVVVIVPIIPVIMSLRSSGYVLF